MGAGGDNTFGTGDDVTLATTTTNAAGLYAFNNLDAGSYQVQFVTPSGYAFSPQDVGNDATDSDANIITGRSQTVTLAAGEINTTVDAGLYQPATSSIGNFVCATTIRTASRTRARKSLPPSR
jgi:hypothetical protein